MTRGDKLDNGVTELDWNCDISVAATVLGRKFASTLSGLRYWESSVLAWENYSCRSSQTLGTRLEMRGTVVMSDELNL